MGRALHLSEDEKIRIITFHECGKSNREIANIIGRCRRTIDQFLKRTESNI